MRKSIQTVWDWMDLSTTTYILISFGLVIRMVALMLLSRLPLASDALSYHKMALDLLSGRDFAPYWPPALSYYLSVFYFLFGTSEFIGRVSMLFFYVLFSVAIFHLVKEISIIRTANLTVLLFAVFPTFIFHSIEPNTQLPVAAYLILAGYLVIAIRKKFNLIHLILLGVILALLILTRASSLLLVGMIALYIFIKTKDPRRFIVPLLVCTVIVSLWLIKVNQMTDRWVVVNEANSFNFFIGNNPYTPLYKTWWFGSHGQGDAEVPNAYRELWSGIQSKPADMQDDLFLQTAVDHILSRPDLFLIRTVNRVQTFFAFDTFTGSALIRNYSVNKLLGLGVIFLDALFYCLIMFLALCYFFNSREFSNQMGNIFFLFLMAVFYAAPYWISFSHPTYHFPVVPLFGITAIIFFEKWAGLVQSGEPIHFLPIRMKKNIFIGVCLVFLMVQVGWISVMWSRI